MELFRLAKARKCALIKVHTTRNPKVLDQCKENIDRGIAILKSVVGCDEQTKTYYVAACCRDLGEIFLDKKDLEKAEMYIQ